jgi:hypothetical protein
LKCALNQWEPIIEGEKMITLDEFKKFMSEGKCGDLKCGNCYPIGIKEDAQLVRIKQLTLEIESLKKQLKEFQTLKAPTKRRVVFNGKDPMDINITIEQSAHGINIKSGVFFLLSLTADGVTLPCALPDDLGIQLTGSRLAAPEFDKKEKK